MTSAAATATARSRLVASVANWLKSRQQVGADLAGNTFFEQYVAADKPRKRLVVYRDPADTHSLNVLWWQWLNYLRDAPPSESELSRLEAHRAALQRKVKKLEADDHKLRLRQYTSGELSNGDGGASPNNNAEQAAANAMQSMIGGSGGGAARPGRQQRERGREPEPERRDREEHETARAQPWSGDGGESGGARRRRR